MAELYEYEPSDYGKQEMRPSMLQSQVKASAILTEIVSVNCKAGVRTVVKMADKLSAKDETILDEIIAAYDAKVYQEYFVAKLAKADALPSDYLKKRLDLSSTASGLVVTTTVDALSVDDETTAVADTSLTKYVLVSLYYTELDGFYIVAFEKTDGEYSFEDEDGDLVQDISEWYVVANGDTLVEVE